MHCTGQTSTHARSFVSMHASVMIAMPATLASPVRCQAKRPGQTRILPVHTLGRAYEKGSMHQAFLFEKVAVVVGPWWEPGDPPERGARVELRLLSEEAHRGSE